MTGRTDRRGSIVLGAAIALVLSACGNGEEPSPTGPAGATAPEPGTFTMAMQPWIGYHPWSVAQEKGYFADNGLEDVELVGFTTDVDIEAALAAGQVDGANVATHSALRLIANGVAVKIVLIEDISTTADAIVSPSSITSVADLAGKKVAYEEGSTSDILLRYALSQNGLSIADVESVPLPAADAGTAVIAGQVDTAVTYEPYITTALNENADLQLLYTAAERPGLISDVFVVREDVLAERPGQVIALAKSWGDAIELYNSSPEEAQTIIAEAVGSTFEELATAFAGVQFYDLATNAEELAGIFATSVVADVAQVATDAGLLEGEVDISAAIDDQYVRAAFGS